MATDVMLSNTRSELTMSSEEIADLLGARHDSVQRTIQRLALKKVIPLPPMVDFGVYPRLADRSVSSS